SLLDAKIAPQGVVIAREFAEIGALEVDAVQLRSSERKPSKIRVDQETSFERRRHERVRDHHWEPVSLQSRKKADDTFVPRHLVLLKSQNRKPASATLLEEKLAWAPRQRRNSHP